MKCEQIQPILLDYAQDKLNPPESEQVREHIRTCDECADLLKDEAELAGRIAAVGLQQPQNDVWALVHAKIRPKRASILTRLDGFLKNGYRVAAAAVVLAMLLLLAIHTIKPVNNKPSDPMPSSMAQVKWSDDPMGRQTDATVDYIDNM
ncbi:zf-HC2 domain-containing protein [bacterium]|nr:zf-HC2 domain-containing protein [bacterium]